ncbi:MAG: alpha/beta hydrolase fold domain-containing protein, partial [Bacteroidota bacterium]|nr:alpha/beta hydrolase fold domain-containing protein [Bacteroidota bacterium]
MSGHENAPSSIAQWLPSEWGSKRAWLESAHRAARVLRRDVAQAKPEQIRQAIELASRLNPGPWGGEFRERLEPTWRGAEVTWKEHDEGTVLWVHGGAFAFGSPRVYRAAAVHLARATRCRIVLPKYRLAPNHTYPQAHDDVFAAMRAVVQERGPVVLMGDSAGGNLAMGGMVRWMQEGLPLDQISALALLSPWCDLREEAVSIQHNVVAHSPFSHEDSMEYSKQYLAGHPATDADVSPLLQSSFEGWPEMYLEWALDEFLAPDVAALYVRL